jgi:hypothetical protein
VTCQVDFKLYTSHRKCGDVLKRFLMAGFIFIKASSLLQSATELQTCRSAERTGTDVLSVSIGGEFPYVACGMCGVCVNCGGRRLSMDSGVLSDIAIVLSFCRNLRASFCCVVSTIRLHTLRIDTEINPLTPNDV